MNKYIYFPILVLCSIGLQVEATKSNIIPQRVELNRIVPMGEKTFEVPTKQKTFEIVAQSTTTDSSVTTPTTAIVDQSTQPQTKPQSTALSEDQRLVLKEIVRRLFLLGVATKILGPDRARIWLREELLKTPEQRAQEKEARIKNDELADWMHRNCNS